MDARIERTEYILKIDAERPVADALWVRPDRTLRHGGRYRLRVQIGRDFAGNLVRSDAEPIDSLLPPGDDGHMLDIVLFEKDFASTSLRRRPLRLPREGASRAVYFGIRAPLGGATAQLRFGVYLGNQLLQSFLLEARLAPEEVRYAGGLSVAVEFTKSAVLGNLDSLKARAASIGVNLDRTCDHTLFLKIDDVTESIPLSGEALNQPLTAFRTAMATAASNDGLPVFPAEGQAETAAQKAAFATAIRGMAVIGSTLHDGLFDRASPPMRDKLRSLMSISGKPLQFLRHDPGFVIPWTIIYDFTLPKSPTAPVCAGLTDGSPCGHRPGDEVVCANGFWGIRHAVEEHLAFGRGMHDAVLQVERSTTGAAVCVADGAGDESAIAFVTDLAGRIAPDAIYAVTTEHVIDDILWQDQTRPAIMMLLGHLDDTGPEQRIKLPAPEAWLKSSDITKKAKLNGDWTRQPRSLVLLMACRAIQAQQAMLHDHALALSGAGAAAIVGPECPVFSKFACTFAREVAIGMLKDALPLGRVLAEFRRSLVRAGNPLGFAFTAFGDADVVIV